ncbi:MAG: restriction endonuclease subunit S [Lachnospiraceae bacterium]|nr:restriction endonuclease subunit S [Lachnospiraceae bacterium]
MGEFKQKYMFSDICTVINGRAYKQEELLDKGKYTVLRVGNFFSSDKWYYSDLELEANKYCDNGDLLYAWSASFGPKIWDGGKVIYHYHIWKLIPSDIVNKQYLYYWLIFSKDRMLSGIHGSVMGHLTKNGFEKQQIELPPLKIQKSVADTLSCLDEKIDINSRINKNLQETAQSIFKSWFVDFEPFQEDEFEDSELGKIPKGWKVGTIGELIADTLGGDWGKETEQGNYTEEVIIFRGADIPEIATGKKGKPPTRFILKKNLEKKRLSAGQIIIEISGGSPTQSTGRTALITRELVNSYEKPLICTNFCRALSFEKDYHSTFLYSLIQYLYNKDVFFLYENGTTGIKNLDTNNLFNPSFDRNQ